MEIVLQNANIKISNDGIECFKWILQMISKELNIDTDLTELILAEMFVVIYENESIEHFLIKTQTCTNDLINKSKNSEMNTEAKEVICLQMILNLQMIKDMEKI